MSVPVTLRVWAWEPAELVCAEVDMEGVHQGVARDMNPMFYPSPAAHCSSEGRHGPALLPAPFSM